MIKKTKKNPSIPVGNPVAASFSVPPAFVIFIYWCQRARLDARLKTRLRRNGAACLLFFCICSSSCVFGECGYMFVIEQSEVGDLYLSHCLSVCACVCLDCVSVCVGVYLMFPLSTGLGFCLAVLLERLQWLLVLCGLTEGTAV